MVKEGKVLLDLEIPQVVSSKMQVFYNPHMRENRDFTLLMLLCMPEEELLVCDPMGASGVRALRLLLEVPKNIRLIYNDISPKAVAYFEELLKRYKVPQERVQIYSEDASLLLRRLRNLDYVDIDPFGSPTPFLESALLPLKRHGLLAITATDTSVLSGTYPKTCLRRYGALPLLSCEFYHEVGIRILIKKVIEEGAKFDYAFRPVFSYSYRHYFRVFFRKDIGPRRADNLLEKVGYLLYCEKCLYRKSVALEELQSRCPYCDNRLLMAGPLWLGELWDRELVESMWEKRGRVDISETTSRLLKRIRQEAKVNSVGFYTVSGFSKAFRIGQPPPIERFLEVFEGVRTHFTGEGFRTSLDHEEVLRRSHELLQRA